VLVACLRLGLLDNWARVEREVENALASDLKKDSAEISLVLIWLF